MSWRVPKLRPRNGDAMNVEVFDGMAPYAEEMGGNLNEHNFKTDAFSSRTHLEEDAAWAYTHDYDVVATNWVEGTIPAEDQGRQQVSKGRWVEVRTDGAVVQQTITTGRGHLWATCSFQVVMASRSTNQWRNDSISSMGIKWGLSVDGVMLEQFACGGDAYVAEDGLKDIVYPVLVDAFVPVDPGEHTITLMVFIIDETSSVTVGCLPEVHTWEIIPRERRS